MNNSHGVDHMKFGLLIFTLCFSLNSFAHLLLIGGGKRPTKALEQFLDSCGRNQARVMIIPWASSSIESSENILKELSDLSEGVFLIAPLELNPQNLMKLKGDLLKATAVFFAGGDQNRLMTTLLDNDLIPLFLKLFSDGVIFAGTSAGTAIMSELMLTGESDLTTLNSRSTAVGKGLGILNKKVIVDQHFVKRMRFNRLAGLILDSKAEVGIGVDEDSALWVENDKLKSFGAGPILFMKSKSSEQLDLKILHPGKELIISRDEFFTFSLLKY
jgi:cyanophycinase